MTLSLHENSTGTLAIPERVITVSFAIPAGKESEFFATHLSGEAQDEIRLLLNALSLIHRWREKMSLEKACMRMEEQKRCGMHFPPRGWDWKSLRRKYYDYTRSGKRVNGQTVYHPGDWRILWNKAKYPEQKSGMPNEFIEFWKYLCEKNQRVCSAAHSELKKIYRTRFDSDGKHYSSIPGYDVWPHEDAFTGLPEGWSLANLYRNTPSEFELNSARVGLASSSKFRLPVLKTRVGLRVGEYFQFDDHEYNLKVNFPGQRQAMRPRGFSVVDVLSSCYFKHSFKPTLWDQDEKMKKALTTRDFMWFVIDTLMDVGFRNDERGTRLVVEWALAAIGGNRKLEIDSPLREDFEKRIYDATAGKVLVERSGRYNRKAHGGQFEPAAPGKGKGNFRFKALIEVGWRLIDDAMASCKGQVGKDRNHSPEQLWGVEGYNKQLLDRTATMTPEDAAMILWPVMMWHEFVDRVMEAWKQINWNHEHKLKDWEKCRFFKREWRRFVGDEWKTENEFVQFAPDEQRAIAESIERDREILTRTRKLSRQEVFNAGRSELARLPFYHLPALVGYESGHGKEINVAQGLFSFEDHDFGTGDFHFVAVDEHGQPLRGKFLCFINPSNPSALVACSADKKVAAVCPPYDPANPKDEAALLKNVGLQGHFTATALAAQRKRHEPDARALDAMKRHNAAIGRPAEIKSPINTRGVSKEDFVSFEGPSGLPQEEDASGSSAAAQLAAMRDFE